jgi:tight adherence protein B
VVTVNAVLIGTTAALVVVATLGRTPGRLPTRPTPAPRPRTLADVGQALDRHLPTRRRRRRDQQLPDALDRLASSLRAGEAVGPSLRSLVSGTADPLQSELRSVARSIERGGSVTDALAGWASSSHASADVRLVAAALTIGAGAGGEVARAVDGVAATLRERHEVRAEAVSLATQARASATLLAATPLAFTALVAMLDARVVTFLFTNPLGIACLVLGTGLEAVGALWMARITRGAA